MRAPLDEQLRPGLSVRDAIELLTPEARVRLLRGLIEQQEIAQTQADRRPGRIWWLAAAACLIIGLVVPPLYARWSVLPGSVITYEKLLFFTRDYVPVAATVGIRPEWRQGVLTTTVEGKEFSLLGVSKIGEQSFQANDCKSCGGPFGVNPMVEHNEKVRQEVERLVMEIEQHKSYR